MTETPVIFSYELSIPYNYESVQMCVVHKTHDTIIIDNNSVLCFLGCTLLQQMIPFFHFVTQTLGIIKFVEVC